MSRSLLNIFFLAAVSSGIGAQEDTSDVKYFAFQAHYGFIIPHSETIEQVSHTKPFGFEIIRSRLHTSAANRQIFNACWSSGIEARYFNYQNPDVLGGVYDITAFVEPVIIFSHNFFITLRGGTRSMTPKIILLTSSLALGSAFPCMSMPGLNTGSVIVHALLLPSAITIYQMEVTANLIRG